MITRETNTKEFKMKLIISIFILTIGAFAQNTKYKDGTDCECDSIVVTNTVETIKMVI